MSFPHVYDAIAAYKEALKALETANPPSSKDALNLLLRRDEIQTWLSDPAQKRQGVLLEIAQLDQRLREQAQSIASILELDALRASHNPPQTAWWWHFPQPTHRWNELDWLWKFFTLMALTASVSLITDIAARFLSGGLDTLGAFAIITPSLLTVLTSRIAFTKTGTAEIEKLLARIEQSLKPLLERIKLPQHFHQEASFSLSMLLLLGLISFYNFLPQIAVFYKNQGDRLFFESSPPQLASALTSYQQALALYPDYLEPHYRLGQIYETLHKYELARNEYEIAGQGGYPLAYNNLGRLLILQEKYASAVQLLILGLNANGSSKWENDTQAENGYLLLKNLGWARLRQGRYPEARNHLLKAVELDSDRAPAYCLLAEVYDAENQSAEALPRWKQCLDRASHFNLDEDEWIHLARQKLEHQDGNQ